MVVELCIYINILFDTYICVTYQYITSLFYCPYIYIYICSMYLTYSLSLIHHLCLGQGQGQYSVKHSCKCVRETVDGS